VHRVQGLFDPGPDFDGARDMACHRRVFRAMFVVPGTGLFENAMTRYGIILHPSSFSSCSSCEFLLCFQEGRNQGLHGDKSFVFDHVFLQEGTEGTEKLCWD
jgi:hypothetical protein